MSTKSQPKLRAPAHTDPGLDPVPLREESEEEANIKRFVESVRRDPETLAILEEAKAHQPKALPLPITIMEELREEAEKEARQKVRAAPAASTPRSRTGELPIQKVTAEDLAEIEAEGEELERKLVPLQRRTAEVPAQSRGLTAEDLREVDADVEAFAKRAEAKQNEPDELVQLPKSAREDTTKRTPVLQVATSAGDRDVDRHEETAQPVSRAQARSRRAMVLLIALLGAGALFIAIAWRFAGTNGSSPRVDDAPSATTLPRPGPVSPPAAATVSAEPSLAPAESVIVAPPTAHTSGIRSPPAPPTAAPTPSARASAMPVPSAAVPSATAVPVPPPSAPTSSGSGMWFPKTPETH